jgi:hypothetical protein
VKGYLRLLLYIQMASSYKLKSREFKNNKNLRSRATYSKNKDKINKRRRELFAKKMENNDFRLYMSLKNKTWKSENPEKAKASAKKTSKKRRESINEYVRNKRKNDALFGLSGTIRARMKRYFSEYGSANNEEKEAILGANLETIKKHLEKQFKKGMTWENRGYRGWHIDHIIPISSAKTKEEMIALFHYTNLQPLWWRENVSKGVKIPNVQLKMTI